jgi:hypothetical protein
MALCRETRLFQQPRGSCDIIATDFVQVADEHGQRPLKTDAAFIDLRMRKGEVSRKDAKNAKNSIINII